MSEYSSSCIEIAHGKVHNSESEIGVVRAYWMPTRWPVDVTLAAAGLVVNARPACCCAKLKVGLGVQAVGEGGVAAAGAFGADGGGEGAAGSG